LGWSGENLSSGATRMTLRGVRQALLDAGFRLPVMRVDARSATQVTFLVKSLLSYRFAETS